MNIKKLENKKIALLGLGKENSALLCFLFKKTKKANITICDFRPKKELKKLAPKDEKKQIKWKTGPGFNKDLEEFDILLRSPGWPINCPGIQKALNNKTVLSSPMQLFFDFCPSKNIIAVTGTKGKGTTSSLIFEILKNENKNSFLGGNIGIAPFSFIEKIKKNDWIILELSSFQLEDIKINPKIAVFTNIFKEHLSPADPYNPNFHTSFSEYLDSKMNIAINQGKDEYFVVNEKLRYKLRKYKTKSKKIYFSKSRLENILAGDFNLENISAAEKVAQILKIDKKNYKKAIEKFSNLPHRLELVRELSGVKYFDNSFSTTPESTILDLKSFKKNIVLIAGGADKGSDFKKLAREIDKRTRVLILFPGKGSDKIEAELKKIKFNKNKLKKANSMKAAVELARKESKEKDVVLLSTACASFGLFKNYKERGLLFQKEVNKIK
jgi:UDP-N-acetylmuramoylalanine--D-glutamate ligase